MSDSVTEFRLNQQDKEMQELKSSIDKLNETIAGMTRTFISAQVCEQRVGKIEGEVSEVGKAVLLLTASSEQQRKTLDELVPLVRSQGELVKSHEVTVTEVKRLKQLLLGGIGLSALVNPTAQGALKAILEALAGQ